MSKKSVQKGFGAAVLALALGLCVLLGCGGSESGDLRGGLAGSWQVVRTLVTANPDFPNGYQDTQLWTFAVTGDAATLSTGAGSINGSFNGSIWVFSVQGYDPLTSLPLTVTVTIIGVDPLKGTNETLIHDPTGARPDTREAFTIEGTRVQ